MMENAIVDVGSLALTSGCSSFASRACSLFSVTEGLEKKKAFFSSGRKQGLVRFWVGCNMIVVGLKPGWRQRDGLVRVALGCLRAPELRARR